MDDAGYDRILTIIRRKSQVGDEEKNCAMEVVIRFTEIVMGVRCRIGNNTMQLLLPDIPGDYAWMDEHVFRFEDGVGVRSEVRMQERAERMARLYRDAGGEDRMGWMVLVALLDRMYMDYDIWVI